MEDTNNKFGNEIAEAVLHLVRAAAEAPDKATAELVAQTGLVLIDLAYDDESRMAILDASAKFNEVSNIVTAIVGPTALDELHRRGSTQ